ncbi:MAG TPA: protein translocase subunit SecF [Geminicoccaceae bacterium]|nr:protein translocase subunit SecF [Geminicoccaceae bacterium]
MSTLRGFRLIPDQTRIPFVRYQYWAYAFSGALILLTLVLLPTKGLNFGIDFRGGILIEVGMPGPAAELAVMRATLGNLSLGEVALQQFGDPATVLIRIERQPGGEAGQLAAVDKVKTTLSQRFGEGISYRRVEFVGPKVSEDLLWNGTQATVYALLAILAYVWFRFEWQFAVGAVVALIHDAVTTIGLFALFGLEFNLTTIAAVLTIIGYSINDTVVIYDRVRENLRKYKAMPLPELIDRSVNETLARTVMTSMTTFLALIALVVFGGPVIRGFTIAMLWGVVVGTYSTVYVAAPIVLHLNLRREPAPQPAAAGDG